MSFLKLGVLKHGFLKLDILKTWHNTVHRDLRTLYTIWRLIVPTQKSCSLSKRRHGMSKQPVQMVPILNDEISILNVYIRIYV